MIGLLIVAGEPYAEAVKIWKEELGDLLTEAAVISQGAGRSELPVKSTIIETRRKGLADFDRQFGASLISAPWTLMVDCDERPGHNFRKVVSEVIKDQDIDVVWFKFENYVDGKDIRSLLGDDWHPRLWRSLRYKPNLIIWPPQAHTYPQIATPQQYWVDATTIRHVRTWEKILESHRKRFPVIHPQARDQEFRFLSKLAEILGKEFKPEMLAC